MPTMFRHPAVWALVALLFLCLVLAVFLARVHHRHARAIYKKHFAANRDRERLMYSAFAFCFTFAIIRVITHMIHAGRGPFRDVSMHGLHIHHLVWGILLLLLAGYAWLWQPTRRHPRTMGLILAALYGVGAALTLDEFALWLNLRDVYWEREGRVSIDAALLFAALLSIGIWGGRFFRELGRAAFGRTKSDGVKDSGSK